MGRLSEINAQIEAIANKRPLPKTDTQSHVESIVEAIRGIQLTINEQEGYDYTPEVQKLGEAVTEALKAHGNKLIEALSQITVNVEAPNVTVEAPAVTGNPEFELNLPSRGSERWEIERDNNGLLKAVVCTTQIDTQSLAADIDIE